MIGFVIVLIVMGLLVGSLLRLLVPGRDPMSLPETLGIGVVGTLVSGFIGRALFGSGGWLDPGSWPSSSQSAWSCRFVSCVHDQGLTRAHGQGTSFPVDTRTGGSKTFRHTSSPQVPPPPLGNPTSRRRESVRWRSRRTC